ncbi:hypothetical protein [Novosphingobium sp.]|uniref:hypothetical protein n=1 Tax=Novosphingobium sp. TaxID=1874826 RepID=UPI0027336FFB|nr:hypothetical protein [Novosphingobium sp.]MDP3907904.1 hypothetical protein [Novosphingobium sp.]
MEHAFLVSFLEERTTPEDFCLEIRNEVDACEAGFRSPTGVGYIVVTDGPLTLAPLSVIAD